MTYIMNRTLYYILNGTENEKSLSSIFIQLRNQKNNLRFLSIK